VDRTALSAGMGVNLRKVGESLAAHNLVEKVEAHNLEKSLAVVRRKMVQAPGFAPLLGAADMPPRMDGNTKGLEPPFPTGKP